MLQHRSIAEARIEARPNLWVIPNSKTSEELIPALLNIRQREFILSDALEQVRDEYDWIFLDTPPSANLLHDLALIASDYLIIPTIMDYFSIGGLSDTPDTIYAISQLRGVKAPRILGVLPTRVELRTNETKYQYDELVKKIGDRHVLPPIPEDVKVREASGRGKTLWEYAPNTPALLGRLTNDDDKNSAGKYGGYLHLCELVDLIVENKNGSG